ncbi:unnamed protein product [Vitrella brassicaformis CCMP3155]|uniref:Mitochondrial inner membrane protease subunit n=2 Tax=Vitrella brassicaformis TaxID=1169539 RepID=A0A0G4F273_VITBC|nr:unnamed protein product [Vitrella brassicaformis CCMP3155]|eukprot:CEM05455.1 unnamed protein product [Vitrella brassicaformis CCMP3155]
MQADGKASAPKDEGDEVRSESLIQQIQSGRFDDNTAARDQMKELGLRVIEGLEERAQAPAQPTDRASRQPGGELMVIPREAKKQGGVNGDKVVVIPGLDNDDLSSAPSDSMIAEFVRRRKQEEEARRMQQQSEPTGVAKALKELTSGKWDALAIGIVVLPILLLRFFVFDTVINASQSMQPVLESQSLVVVNKLIKQDAFQVGDVVEMSQPDFVKQYVKRQIAATGDPSRDDEIWRLAGGRAIAFRRIIAKEGDTVAISPDGVLVNGVDVRGRYKMMSSSPPMYSFGPEVVPNGCVFLLGDNMNESIDSHNYGFVPLDALRAKAVFKVLPPGGI